MVTLHFYVNQAAVFGVVHADSLDGLPGTLNGMEP